MRRISAPFGFVRDALGAASCMLLSSCSGIQHALDVRGPQAERIAELWWVLFAICTVVLVVVVVLAVWATFRGRRTDETEIALSTRQSTKLVLAGGVIIPTIVLIGLLVHSVAVGNAITSEPAGDALVVDVVGHQWWWEVNYPDRENVSRGFRTANELRIPVGRPVRVQLASRDVIHSFWVPNLHGKTDLIPGQSTATWLQADEPGTFRGQCAEFCGLQHAHMAFMVVAEPPERFEAWAEQQRRQAEEPASSEAARGRDVFLSNACVLCHTVRGTIALGSVAPDLTHVASRLTLAAGTLPNTRGHLAGWILNPQDIKPGNRMPPTNLEPADLHALLSFLESLK